MERAYQVNQRAFEGLDWKMLLDHFDDTTSNGYSVSVCSQLRTFMNRPRISTTVLC